jgi:MtN3 and saliva related transmembrane protein
MQPQPSADLIGSIAGFLTTAAFVPQVIKTLRSRSTRDISLVMFAAFTAGVAFWLLYGALIGSLPVIAANAVTLVMAGTILAVKLSNLRRE